MKEIKLKNNAYEVADEVYELFDGMAKELTASRELIQCASVAMQPMAAILPMVINPATEAVNAMEMMEQMGKLKKDDNVALNFAKLKAAQENYAMVMSGLNPA